MSISVNKAFRIFLDEVLAIPSGQKDIANASKDYLLGQINALADKKNIPAVIKTKHLLFGSFYRGTKNQPLDDIDIVICYSACNSVTILENSWDDIKLVVNGNDKTLLELSDKKYKSFYSYEVEYELNSNRIKNNLLSNLQNIENYKKAEMHARGEAVTLSLKSYDWTFDIVPSFYYEDNGETIYVIPNGKGRWKKTNPQKEKDRLKETNKLFKNVSSEVIRLIKFWNERGKMPTITSYVLETAVLDFFDTLIVPKDDHVFYPDLLFRDALRYIRDNIFNPIYDSKNIEGNINTLSYLEQYKIRERANSDYKKACSAIDAELCEKDVKKSINIWKDIFGDSFLEYE